MKKKFATTLCAAAISLTICMPAFAGQWLLDDNGWWWQNDDGSWPINSWQWLDGNNDGISENYYFNQDGYILTSTITPDGHEVNADGAWIENGVVQIQGAISNSDTGNQITADANIPNVEGIYTGIYDGKQIQAVFEKDGDTTWVEIDFFIKDSLPSYKGNGLFEDDYYSYQFAENSFTFKDVILGETIYFVRQ